MEQASGDEAKESEQMRIFPIVSIVTFPCLLGFGSAALGQAPGQRPGLEIPLVTPGPGWKSCPRCQNEAHVAEDRKKANVDTRPFDAHDISGVWGDNGIALDMKMLPPLTPYGQRLFDATKSDSTEWNSCNCQSGFCSSLNGGMHGGPSGRTVANCRRTRRFIDIWGMLSVGGREIHSLSRRMDLTTDPGLLNTAALWVGVDFHILPK